MTRLRWRKHQGISKTHERRRSNRMTDRHKQAGDRCATDRCEVLIAGGGVAGLEAAFALRELAGDRVRVRIVAPTDEFVYRPMAIAEPFTSGWATHYPLPVLAEHAGAELIQDTLLKVDAAAQTVRTSGGATLSYDALLITLGASVHERYEHATTVDDAHMDDLLHGLVQDIEEGYVHRLAIVVPAPMPWQLPAYELALMTSERAWDMQADLSVTVLTPEKAPLESFGLDASADLRRLLEARKIQVVTSAYCEVPEAKMLRIHPGDRSLAVDRIVALPELRGPRLAGVPSDRSGFIPIDGYAAVPGVNRIWAAGDATDFPIKHGGVSAQMADTAAASIAALAGASITPHPFDPTLEGVLLTGGRPRYLRRGSHDDGSQSEMLELERNDRTPKIAARYLAPALAALRPSSPRPRAAPEPLATAG
jgi:sulfide:quinone oxidoreductase